MKLKDIKSRHSLEWQILAAALALVASVVTLKPNSAQAQSNQIILQCVAPLVPNSDGSDCVRPAETTKTCPQPTILDNGRCREPTRYIRFNNCTGPAGKNFYFAYYRNNKILLFRSDGSGSEITPAQAELMLTIAKDSSRGNVTCKSIRG